MKNLSILLFLVLATASLGHAQAAPSMVGPYHPNQISAAFQWTLTDYSIETDAGHTQRVTLDGGELEYSWRRFQPIEIFGSAQYAQGSPVAQRLASIYGGAGYFRQWHRWMPFARLMAGAARTSSSRYEYLYDGSRTGFSTALMAGTDCILFRHLSLRAVQIETQYLPFGAENSLYWSIGSGFTYRFSSNR